MDGSRSPGRPNALNVNLAAAAKNMRNVRKLIGQNRKIFAVVKADAYGFGATELARLFAANGADALAIADLAEGISLRRHGIEAPILMFPNVLPHSAAEVLSYRITPTVVDLDTAQVLSDAAADPCDVFVQIDVGVERLGIPAEHAAQFVMDLLRLPNLRLAGLYAHAHSKPNAAYAQWQLDRFTSAVGQLEAAGISVPARMLAASPFVIRYPNTYLNAVDPGRMLYGITYPDETPPIDLDPVFLSLTTRIIAIKDVYPRREFRELSPFPIDRPMRIGVMPIGTGDGLAWLSVGRGLIRGIAAPIVGDLALEHSRIDLTAVPDAKLGDEVVLIGRQGSQEISLSEIARRHGQHLNQVAATVGPRVARIYRDA